MSAKKRKASEMDVEEYVKKGRESRKKKKGEYVTPELLDPSSRS